MKYFTRERYLALQNFDDDAMGTADADWDGAVEQYEAYLTTIRPELPDAIRQLLDGFYLHDARVLSMGQQGDTFVISLHLDVPPNELITITYQLMGQPAISKETFAWATGFSAVNWLYDEIESIRDREQSGFVHSILLSNGWEVRLPFSSVHLATAVPVLPLPPGRGLAATPAAASQPV